MKVWSIEELKAARRQGTFEEKVPFVLNGKTYEVTKKIVNGEMEAFELSKPIGEMLTSEASRKELLQKVVLDVELGREQVPILYTPIYERIQDANFPKLLEAKWAQYGTVIFTEHLEGEEVRFGSLQAEQGPTVAILGYAAGFEYTKEMEIFNQVFNLELLNRAFGEAYNAKLNDMHLGPILSFVYPAGNKTAFQGDVADPRWLRVYKTLVKALADTAVAKRPATVLLAASADRPDIEQALRGGQVNGTTYPPVSGISDIIYYDGWSTQVGKKTYTYSGVAAGKCYLIRPKRGFKELVKQDLQINATMGDITRLVESQIVGDFWRGVYAALTENVQEVALA
ncbi:MAG TPA: aspartate ammonia-lyase [Firmicutes bacterium]|nr:aspartate ammonia-lyase [Bacillota bacterium]